MVERKVSDVMTETVYTVRSDATMADVQALMTEQDFRHVPVIGEDAELVGLVSMTDVVAYLGRMFRAEFDDQQERLADIPVQKAMVRTVETISPDDSLSVAADIMVEHKLRCLPVVEGRRLVGILTEADFVRLVAELERQGTD